MIEFINLHKAYDRPVLKGVTLRVATGEVVGIVGPSGGGKSVLLKMTNGLVIPDQGDVRIERQSIYFGRGLLDRWREEIGYVFQYAALFDSMNVFDNVSLGIPDVELRRMSVSEKLTRVVRALRAVRLSPRMVLGKLPSELSGGMRKRVGIARAIIGKPRILLYDEPVTGLDPVTAAAISRLIATLTRQLSATSIVVTHDVEGALEICDRIALLDDGRIRYVGPPEGFRSSRDPLVRAFVDRRAAALMNVEEANL